MCITESLCCAPETNTTLYINYTPIKFIKKKFITKVDTSDDLIAKISVAILFPFIYMYNNAA